MSKQIIQDNLFKALGIFIEAMRSYIVVLLQKNDKTKWADFYYNTLLPQQKHHWEAGISSGTAAESLIDFNNLKGFALGCKDILKNDFKNKVNNLPTWLDDIAEVRNKCNHFTELSVEEVERAYSNIVIILQHINNTEVEKEINNLKENRESKPKVKVIKKVKTSSLLPWFKNVTPHIDIRQGRLDESVFAANLAEVSLGNGREIYQNPSIFFSKTFFTSGLKTILRKVIKGLNGGQDAENRVISLQTGFGGGKTHALISLYHIANLGKKALSLTYTKDLFKDVPEPLYSDSRVAVFTNTSNDPAQGRTVENIHIRTLWGELAYQLGGKEAYNIIKANDESRTTPKGMFKKVLEKHLPALILIDELADYCVAASGIQVGSSTLSDQTVSFIQELSESIASIDKCVMVATLPASVMEVANSENASQILTSLSNRLGRVGADTKPVADEEIFEVIRRRLFEDLGDEEEHNKALTAYTTLYQSLCTELPDYVSKSEYKTKMAKSYPFHPELIDMFRVRWASHYDFQRTRGVLRLLASIVSDLWKRQNSLVGTQCLIHTSDVNFENLDALSGQLKKLYGNGFDAVMTADVTGSSSNAFKIDKEKSEYGNHNLTQGTASTILLGSFGSIGANKGISIQEIKLCVVKPNAFNHNNVNGALDILESYAYYLYYSTTGTAHKRYWFHTKPNINILINQARNDIKQQTINTEVLKRINKYASNITRFTVLVNPSLDIPEQHKLIMIILSPEYLANPGTINGNTIKVIEKLATKKGNTDRIYRNTIFFLVCSEIGASKLFNDIRDYLACIKIQEEYQSQLEKDQKEEIKRKIDEYTKNCDKSIAYAYSIIAKYSSKEGITSLTVKQFRDSLDIQVNSFVYDMLQSEEWILEGVGMSTLRKNNLIPTTENPIQAKDIYETFLRFDDKPMILNKEAVSTNLLRYCFEGQFAIATGEKNKFEKIYYKEPVPFFDITDPTYWVVDKSLYKPEEAEDVTQDTGITTAVEGKEPTVEIDKGTKSKIYKTLTVKGKVDVTNYHQIFTSFINPLLNNQVEVDIHITAKSTKVNPITETGEQYKITKESAKQLGLDFEVEE